VLDLCAAPGGKTATLARGAAPGGLVVAGDVHAQRLRGMREQLERLGVRNVHAVALDATHPLPLQINFDRILVDAPCSGTGTLARNPEIRWRLRSQDLADFHRRQVALLTSAVASLRPGGRLVYSTCSLEAEENEDVIQETLKQSTGLRTISAAELARTVEPFLASGVAGAALFDASGAFRTFPPNQHTDGFFAMVLEKR
jgi:16S rRNA (cytosine967-C5)-methyltransferase